MAIGAIAAVAGGALSGLFGSSSAKKAASAQASAANKQAKIQKQMFQRVDKLQGQLYEDQLRDIQRTHGVTRAEADRMYNAQIRNISSLEPYRADAARVGQQQIGNARTSISDTTAARDRAMAGYAPYVGAGHNALSAYMHNLGLGDAPEGYTGLSLSPGAQFLMEQGRGTIEGGAAGRGGLYSGGTLEELERFRQGLAATDRDNQMAQIFGVANLGGQAADAMAGAERGFAGDLAGLRAGLSGAQEADYLRRLGLDTSLADARTAASNALGQARIGIEEGRLSNLGAARTNRANLYGTAANQYTTGMTGALANLGNANAAGAIGVGNALAGGINTGLNIYGMMQQFQQPNALSPVQAGGASTTFRPMARPA